METMLSVLSSTMTIGNNEIKTKPCPVIGENRTTTIGANLNKLGLFKVQSYQCFA